MSSQFKNRLVGITILVALVVIFLPALIDGKKDAYQQEFVATPIQPEKQAHSKAFTQSTAQQDLIIDESAANNSQKQDQENGEWSIEEVPDTPVTEGESKNTKTETAKVKTTTPKTSKIKQKALDKPAWTIQLGAFQNKANIIALIKKLNKAGFQVHTMPRDIIDGQLTRVFVGPNVSKEKLQGQLPRLKRLTNLKGKIVPFNPVEP